NQATTLESQPIHMIQLLSGQTLSLGLAQVCLYFKERQVRTGGDLCGLPRATDKQSDMEIIDVSEAQVNKPLWIKFKFDPAGLYYTIPAGFFTSKPITGTYFLTPERGAGNQYTKTLGIIGTTTRDLSYAGLGRSGESTVTLGGSCE